jgi:hypothetical protein
LGQGRNAGMHPGANEEVALANHVFDFMLVKIAGQHKKPFHDRWNGVL